jgi:hypothetical protein
LLLHVPLVRHWAALLQGWLFSAPAPEHLPIVAGHWLLNVQDAAGRQLPPPGQPPLLTQEPPAFVPPEQTRV